MQNAIAFVVQQDLLTARNIIPTLSDSESGAYQLGATAVLRTTVEQRNGRIHIGAIVVDLATQRNRKVIEIDGSSPGELLPSVNLLAKKLASEATNCSTKSDRALQIFTQAAQTQDVQQRIQLLNDATATDPTFGLAYIALVQTLAESGQDAGPVLGKAVAHRDAFTPFDRARLNSLATRISHAPLSEQEQATATVLQLAPNDLDAITTLGTERFLLDDGPGGERLLKRAIDLGPGNAKLREQLAAGLIETKQFAAAEKILQAMDNNPSILPALASCIYLEGDVTRADAVFGRFLGLRAVNDPVAPFLRASWLAISGRRSEAIDLLAATNFTNPGLRSVALAQAAVWQLASGNRASADTSAAAAAQLDPRPTSPAAIAVLLARAGASPNWREQVNATATNDTARQLVLGYGLFLNTDYAGSAQVWEGILMRSGNTDLRARTMLAASLDRAGHGSEAKKISVQPFVPELGDLYAAVSFDEMRRLLRIGMR